MKHGIILFFAIFFLSCSEDKECVIIRDKEEVEGNYYFYFSVNYYNTPQYNNIAGGGIDNQYASGKVSKKVYDDHSVGDEYCF